MKRRTIFSQLEKVIKVIAFSAIGFVTKDAIAQTAASYTFSASSGTYSALSASATSSSLSTTEDDAISTTITFPSAFSFTFAGTSYTQAKVGSNGYLVFGTSGGSIATNNLSATGTSGRPLLAPLWDDLLCTAGVKYELTGTSPNRVLTFEWLNMKWNWQATGAVISFQIKLYETSNIIQYVYRQDATAYNPGSTGGASIGIVGATATDFLSLSGSGTTPSTSTATSTNSIATKPATGQIFQFNPPVSCSGTPTAGSTAATAASICLGSSTTLSLPTASIGAGISYQWQSSPDGIVAYTNITGATSSTYVVTPTSSTFYRCVVTCSSGPTSVNSTPIQILFSNNIISVTNNFRCGTGTVSLAAGGTPGTTISWYAAASGGASIGSGSPFTTPSIGATTNFYAASELIGTGSVTIGSGASTTVSSTSSSDNISPFDHYYGGFKGQYLFRASELSAMGLAAGNITAISLDIVSGGILYQGFNVSIGATSATALTGTALSGLTTVFSTTAPAGITTPASGIATITFSSGFYWDGTSNIVVETCWSNNNTGGTGTTVRYDATSFVSHNYYRADSKTPAVLCANTTMTTLSLRPKVIFNGTTVCSSPRVAVVATVNAPPAFTISGTQTVCNNSVATVNVSSTLSNYNSYTWTPATGLYTDAAAAVPYVAGASASTVYAKTSTAGATIYKCSAINTTSLCAAIDSVTITNLPSSVTTIATPSSICVSGNTTLTLNPSTGYGAAGFVWQSSTDNSSFSDIIPAATGSTYVSSILTGTRYFRVTLKSSAGTTCLNSTSDTGLVYGPGINTSAGASRCGPGSVTLTAGAVDGTISWFAASSGGSPIGSGTSFLTPSLTSTTTYYAEARATPDLSYTVGSGGTTLGTASGENGITPFCGYYEGQHTQHLILASDLIALGVAPGPFTSMTFNVSTKNSTMAYTGYTLKLGNTTASELSAGLVSTTFTTVYGPSNYTTSTGVNTFNLGGGFVWNGTSNIVVDVCFSNDPTSSGLLYSNNDVVTATAKSYVATYGWYQDNSALCGTTGGSSASSSNLPVIGFNRSGCVNSTRTAVVATINTVPIPTISPATGPVQICAGNTTTFTAGGGGNYQWKNASGILVGETASTFTTGITGTYRVVVTTPSTGCKDSSVFVGVNVNPTPTVSILPSGTRAICADSAQKYTSVITGSGLTYQWFNGGTLITGATRDSFSASTAGVYSLRVYLGTCSDTSNDATLIINPLPASSFTKTGTTGAICLGSTLELTALSTPAGYTYQWMLNGLDIPGATSRIYNAPTGGLYTVRIKDGNNCRKISDTMSIINTPMGVPNLLPKEVRFCEGTEIVLYSNAGPYAKLFSWTKDGTLTGDSSATIATGIGGVYDVTVEDVYGCVLTSAKVSLTVDPLPVKPVVTQSGNVLSTVLPYTTYQWYRNGKAIAGSTKRNHTLLFDGYYHVVVTNNVNCLNSSDSVMIKNLSVQSISRNDVEIKVYPNPTQNQVTIDAPISVNLSVKDITGKQVMSLKDAKSVDMSLFADGIYIFTLTDNNGVILKMDKVIKKTN